VYILKRSKYHVQELSIMFPLIDQIPDLKTLSDAGHPLHALLMEIALEEARAAYAEDEVPVGAVIVSWEKGVIARAHNQREQLQDPTAHAEMLAITQAASALQSWRLEGCALYVTLEPCPMCAGAIVQARLPLVVFGAFDSKAGACQSLYSIPQDPRLNHRAMVVGGVREAECQELLRDFFRQRRRSSRTEPEQKLS
jgi:tRNA(adenine34) deaminase